MELMQGKDEPTQDFVERVVSKWDKEGVIKLNDQVVADKINHEHLYTICVRETLENKYRVYALNPEDAKKKLYSEDIDPFLSNGVGFLITDIIEEA